jgi:uncharacterized membrane protein
MLQGHTFDAILGIRFKQMAFYVAHDFFHGFVAPIFLFASGVAFGVSTIKKWEDHLFFNSKVWRRIFRFLSLLAIGYALHLPFFSLEKVLEGSTAADIERFLQADALHCIGIALLCYQLIILIVRKELLLSIVAATVGIFIVVCSPFMWNIRWSETIPMALAAYINNEIGSWFPLFPWGAYLSFGVVFGHLFVEARERQKTGLLMKMTVVVGVMLVMIGIIVSRIPINVYPIHDFWKVNPAIILARLGFVLLSACFLFYIERFLHLKAALPAVMGQESLFIYMMHLPILYGSVINQGLAVRLGGLGNLFEASGIALLLIVALSYLGFGWNRFKKNYYRESVLSRWALALTFLAYFVVRPF